MAMEGDKKSGWSFSQFERMMFPGWLFLSGNEELRRTAVIAYPTVLIAVFGLVIFGSLRLIWHDTIVGLIDLSFALVMTGIIMYHRKTKRHNNSLAYYMGITAYGIFCICLFLFSGFNMVAYLWTYTFPLMVFPIAGSRRGMIAAVLFLISLALLLVLAPAIPFMTSYPRGFAFTFIPSILAVSGLSYLYERNRERNQQQLNLANAALRRSNEEMEQQIHKRTAELERSEKNYRFLAERMNDIVWTTDLNLNVTYVSPSVNGVLGFSQEEYRRLPFHERVTPDSFNKAMAIFASELEQEKISGVNPERNLQIELEFCHKDGSTLWMESMMNTIRNTEGNLVGIYGVSRDITERKRVEEALEKRIVALTQPLDDVESIAFEDIFNLTDLQRLQDLFADAWGVAALITRPDGTPITQPGNFTYLCSEFIRKSEKGFRNCQRSDAMLGQHNTSGPTIHTCLSAGLCGAGASITVGGRHIANWLIGQVRNETQSVEQIIEYAREIGVDETAFREAFLKVPIMPQEKFEQTAHALFALANQLSTTAYQNIQQARFIAERKQAEEALRRSEEKYRLTFSSISDVIYTIDPDLRISSMSPNVEKILGYKIEELINKPFQKLNLLTPESLEKAASDALRVLSGEQISASVYEFISKDGTRRFGEISGSPLIHEGKIVGFTSVARDITERKQAEEALRKSEEYFKAIIQNSTDLIIIVDKKGTILFASPSSESILGYEPEEMIGKRVIDFILPADIPRAIYDFGRAILTKDVVIPNSFHVRHKDGSERILEGVGKNLLDNEAVAGFVMNVRDITERKQAEELYKTLADSSQAGVFIVQDRKFKFVNPHIPEYSGYSENELIGNDSLNFVHHEDRALLRVNTIDMLKGKRTNPYEYRIIDRKGNIKRLMETVRSITYGGKRAVLGNTMDITEQYQMESLLRQAQKMESIGTLAGGIAHDFNNILGAILGYTDVALTDCKLDDRLRGYLEQVYKAGERARDLVKQILTFSRQQEQERKPVLIAPIIKEGIKLLRSSLPTTIKITQNIKDTSIMVLADPTQIHQVVMNLCTNASHAMRERGGVLDIQLVRERIESSGTSRPLNLTAGDYAKLTVSDTGHGIDAAIIDRIFDPFFTTKGPGEGTGLGLSVVYGIVRDHGGVIDVYSEPNKGTTVTVYFPLIETEELIQERMSELIPGGSERILFIDDEAALVELGRMMLTSLGYRITSRTSGIEALAAFRANPYGFDLVITDMTMPNMRGDDLARELLKIRPDIPIILCTGFSEMISEEKAKNLGIHQFIMKPINRKDLAKAVRDVLDS